MSHAVNKILKDEQYIGTYVGGKTYQISKNKLYYAPKSEWVKIPNKHPAIIGKEVFEQVQLIRTKSKRKMIRRDYLLSGKVVCGCCGIALSYYNNSQICVYRCMKTYADPAAACHKLKQNADVLEGAVMAIIKKQAETVLASDDLSNFRKMDDSEWLREDYLKQINQLVGQRQECYEKFVGSEIDRDMFQNMMADYASQIDRLNNQLSFIKQADHDSEEKKKCEALAETALSETASQKDIVDALVEKVLVFPNNHVEIRWKFANFAEVI